MSTIRAVAEQAQAATKFLKRSRKSLNLASYHPVSHLGRRSGSSMASHSSHRATNGSSEDLDALHMTPPRSRRHNYSLSSNGNGVAYRATGASDNKESSIGGDAAEDLSWNIIDREISEWQYICRTGQPYWWSTESRRGRPSIQPEFFIGSSPSMWTRQLDERLQPEYKQKRRAMSESYLSDPSTRQDFAHMIAVQLLGACFTLPPDQLQRAKHNLCSAPSSTIPLISSLRMHTRYRYSPCFGHQARNTSPSSTTQELSRAYDGPTFLHSPPGPPSSTRSRTAEIRTSSRMSKRRKGRRALHVTEDSKDQSSAGSDAGITAYGSPQGRISEHKHRKAMSDCQHNLTTPGACQDGRTQDVEPLVDNDDGNDRGHGPFDSHNTSYRLFPVIRSEPRSAFAQPVKEMVVRRWKSVRRRLGGSLHSTPSTSFAESAMQVDPGSEGSGRPESVASSDGTARRRRARERGDIHSSSMDSTPHFNTPQSGQSSPTGAPKRRRPRTAKPSPHRGPLHHSEEDTKDRPTLRNHHAITAPPKLASESGSTQTQEVIYNNIEIHKSLPSVVSPGLQFSSRRRQARRRSRSMLSESWTPHNLSDSTPVKDIINDAPMIKVPRTASPSSASEASMCEFQFPRDKRSQETVSVENAVARELRSLRLQRTSTSGTQVFTPKDDGVELNGLPAGPTKDLWDRRPDSNGRRRERSFL